MTEVDYCEIPTPPRHRPTDAEINAVSDRPKRFKCYYSMACEVSAYAAANGGRLPEFCWKLTSARWSDLARTMRELDEIEWLRRIAA